MAKNGATEPRVRFQTTHALDELRLQFSRALSPSQMMMMM